MSEFKKQRLQVIMEIALSHLKRIYYLAVGFALVFCSFSLSADNSILIGKITAYKSDPDLELEKNIQSKLVEKLEQEKYPIAYSKKRGLSAVNEAKTNHHYLYLDIYYTSKSNLKEFYLLIYDPTDEALIDSIYYSSRFKVPEEIQLPDDEIVADTPLMLETLFKNLVINIRSNSLKQESRENIEVNFLRTQLSKSIEYQLRISEEGKKAEEILKLLNPDLEVVTATQKAQNVNETPAGIIVVSGKEISRKGYLTVLDVLRDITMIDINSPGQGYQLDIGGRGVNPYQNMGKYWQILIDGHDMSWKQFYRNYLSPAWISVDNIKRIEIVKGPNSAVWGSNAVIGVINIITKDAGQESGNLISLGGGSNNTYFSTLSGAGNTKNGVKAYSSISIYNENVPRKIKEWSDVKGRDVYVNNNDSRYINSYTKLEWEGFTLNTMYSADNSHKAISSFSVGGKENFFQIQKYFGDLQWQKVFFDKFTIRMSGYSDWTEWGKNAKYEDNPYNPPITDPAKPGRNLQGSQNFIQPMSGRDKLIGYRFYTNYEFNNNMSVSLGGTYEFKNTILWHFPKTVSSNWEIPIYRTFQWGMYTMWNYKPHPMFQVNAGIRHDKDNIFGSQNSPRVGFVINPSSDIVIKLLYGEAFKAPSLFELFYTRKNNVYGNPLLHPEYNKTYEGQIIYTPIQWLITKLTLYDMDIDGVIVYGSRNRNEPLIAQEQFSFNVIPDKTSDYRQQMNKSKYKSRGAEFELDIKPDKHFTISLNTTYRRTTDVKMYNPIETIDPSLSFHKSLDYTASHKYSASVSYNYLNSTFTLIGRYEGPKDIPENLFKEPGYPYNMIKDTTIRTDSYNILNFVFYQVNLWEDLSFTLRIDNIFNRIHYDAGFDVLYNQPGRSGYFKLGYNF